MSKPLAFFKGNFVDIKNANVNIQTHALHYGTAVFEGIRGNWNTKNDSMIIFRLREHYERLIRGCSILRVKISGNYVNSILAKTEAVLAGFDEAIILNQSGSVSEGSGENLFIINDGEITTPPLSDNNLDGITRNCVFEIAKQELGIQIKEKTIFRSELYLADEVLLEVLMLMIKLYSF